MHRVRTWARKKAHGKSPLVSDSRRPAAPTTQATTTGTDVVPPQTEAPVAESEADKPASQKKNVGARFYVVTKDILFSNPLNILLVFVPVGIAAHFVGWSPGIIFAMNAIAIVPLAGLLAHATESVASRLGDTIGALMNVTFGNAVELIIFIIALVKDEIRIVQASLLGSILSNLLLILGMCFLLGGLRFREQIYNSTVTQTSACLLSLSVISLLLPTAFHASFNNTTTADDRVLKVSRGSSVVLLLVYILYLLFQLNSHAYMYESTPQHIIDRESQPGPAHFFFESSSDSSSDSSDSDSSTRSTNTAKRIRRMMKGKRSRKQSASSQHSPKIRSPPSEADRPESAANGEVAVIDDVEAIVAVQVSSVGEDGPDGDDMTSRDSRRRRKHKKHRRHHHDRRHRQQEAIAESSENPEPVLGLPTTEGNGDTRRVDFALVTDLEAQGEAAKTRPFSFRTLRPTMPKTVFNAPQPPLAEFVPSLRRAASMPNQGSFYRQSPGAVPPIVPIIVNSSAKAKTDNDEKEHEPAISRTTAIILLLVSTGLVALCAEFMVGSINDIVGNGTDDSGISEAFIGLILLPIVGNAAEHVTAVTVATKNKMDLAIGVALGSSIQIAIFVTPLVVIIGWIMNKDMSLFFTLFETVCLFVSAFIVNFLVLDGRSNYLEGALLCSAYIIIALAAFFYPNSGAASELGGGSG